MIGRWASLPDPQDTAGQAILQEQFRTLTKQIPVMYALLLMNSFFLCLVAYEFAPITYSVGMPAVLSVAVVARSVLWFLRRNRTPGPDQIRRHLRGTLIAGSLFALLFGAWGQLLFSNADLLARACIALFIFINCITICYCVQSLPWAGQAVLLLGGLPMAFRLLATGEELLIGMGFNVLFIAGILLKMLHTNYASFTGLILSRAVIQAEQERARAAEERANSLAYRDPLTGLPNRNALGERLDALVSGSGRSEGMALLIIDLDRFKSVNDVHGHAVGDLLLEQVAGRIRETAKKGEAFRLGGDEFAVLVPTRPENGSASRCLAEAIVRALCRPFQTGDLVHHIGASIGMSLFPHDARDRQTLMRRADIALYRAKESGRSRSRAFEPEMDAEISRRSLIERELRAAVAADELRPYYQPLVELSTGRTTGFELLARWPREDNQDVGPELFIPVAEETGLINDLMLKLLARGCTEAAGWDPSLTVAINVSPVQLRDPWLSQKILRTLTRHNFPPSRLAVEITENALLTDTDNARRTVQSLQNQGIRVGLDDFGTGYSSLQHLRMLPFDKIKIDRSFVQAIGQDAEALKIVRAITGLARTLDVPVIAEGIENQFIVDQLRALGCEEGQGFHLGRPMSGSDVAAVLASGEPLAWNRTPAVPAAHRVRRRA